jgi:hypothetical protein
MMQTCQMRFTNKKNYEIKYHCMSTNVVCPDQITLTFFEPMTLFILFNTQTMRIQLIIHNSIAMTS